MELANGELAMSRWLTYVLRWTDRGSWRGEREIRPEAAVPGNLGTIGVVIARL